MQEVIAVEWTECLRSAISYMEKHILENISAEDVADSVNISSFYFQNGFKLMTGYTVMEYIKKRRLYLAALEIISEKVKVLDLAFKYGYETPESFTKAFSRFHGVSPAKIKGDTTKIKIFLPLKIIVTIQGGNGMDYTVEKMQGFKVIGFEKEVSFCSGYQEIPKFWNEFCEKYLTPLFSKEKPENQVEQIICDCKIGEYGVCIDDIGKDGKFRYLIAGNYNGGKVPDGMTVYEFPDTEWVKFRCVGAMPGALQTVNTKIFKEWLPGNKEFDIAMGCNIEWYSQGDTSSADYESGIWVPVNRI